MMPQRITLERTKGWQMPENTVKVCRGPHGLQKKYGNPFPVETHGRPASLLRYRNWLMDECSIEEIRQDLQGRNLACWCKPDEDCHADILLKLANP